MNRNRKIIIYWGYGAALVLNLFWIFQRHALTTGQQLSIVLFTVILYGTSSFFLVSGCQEAQHRRQLIYTVFFALFLYYLFMLAAILFWDGFFLSRDAAGAVNLVPFRSIVNYWHFYLRTQSNVAVANLFGNLALFAPMGFFLPLLFRSMRKWYWFLPTILLLTCGVEVIQYFAQIGSSDIDDVILNTIGALLIYLAVRLGSRPAKKNR